MKNPAAVALGRLGGKAGTGPSKARTSAQARAAVRVRWAMKAFRAVFYVREQVNGSFRLVRHSTKWYGSREELEAAHDLTNPNWECVQIKERGNGAISAGGKTVGETLSHTGVKP